MHHQSLMNFKHSFRSVIVELESMSTNLLTGQGQPNNWPSLFAEVIVHMNKLMDVVDLPVEYRDAVAECKSRREEQWAMSEAFFEHRDSCKNLLPGDTVHVWDNGLTYIGKGFLCLLDTTAANRVSVQFVSNQGESRVRVFENDGTACIEDLQVSQLERWELPHLSKGELKTSITPVYCVGSKEGFYISGPHQSLSKAMEVYPGSDLKIFKHVSDKSVTVVSKAIKGVWHKEI